MMVLKTRDQYVKARIMATKRGGKLKGTGIYLNDDLTKSEQSKRKQMMSVYRDLRAAGVRCFLDRSTLVVGDRRFFDFEKALAAVPCLKRQQRAHSSDMAPSQ